MSVVIHRNGSMHCRKSSTLKIFLHSTSTPNKFNICCHKYFMWESETPDLIRIEDRVSGLSNQQLLHSSLQLCLGYKSFFMCDSSFMADKEGARYTLLAYAQFQDIYKESYMMIHLRAQSTCTMVNLSLTCLNSYLNQSQTANVHKNCANLW